MCRSSEELDALDELQEAYDPKEDTQKYWDKITGYLYNWTKEDLIIRFRSLKSRFLMSKSRWEIIEFFLSDFSEAQLEEYYTQIVQLEEQQEAERVK